MRLVRPERLQSNVIRRVTKRGPLLLSRSSSIISSILTDSFRCRVLPTGCSFYTSQLKQRGCLVSEIQVGRASPLSLNINIFGVTGSRPRRRVE